MHSKVSSDWLPSYIKATRPVLEILKMAGYFPDSPCMCCSEVTHSKVRTCVVQSQNSMFPQNGILYSTVHVHHVLFQTQQNYCTILCVENDF